jgi:hypothetical protein
MPAVKRFAARKRHKLPLKGVFGGLRHEFRLSVA